METKPINILLIENDLADAHRLSEMLVDISSTQFTVQSHAHVDQALDYLRTGHVDLVLLDLDLTDSYTLEPFVQLHREFPDVPIIVLTETDDDYLALKFVQMGAQDYLVKHQFQSNLLIRSIRYAIERQRLQIQLEESHQQEQQEREMRSLEQMSRSAITPVTARLFGMPPLRESLPDIFNELVQHYGDLLDRALEQRTYKVEHRMSEELRLVSEQLGFLKAGPRDVVRMHSTALKRKTDHVAPQKAQAYVEEGRLMVLELMGYLVSYYRNFALGFSGRVPRSLRDQPAEGEIGHE